MTNQHLASSTMRGRSQEQMLRRRDAASGEMEVLSRLANDPTPSNEEIIDYILNQVKKGHIPRHEASQILATMPHHPEALRQWARIAFATIMHQGIHAHAAFPREEFPSPASAQAGVAPQSEDVGNER